MRSIFSGVVPSSEHDFLKYRGFKTLIDIGANKGQFSMFFYEISNNQKIIAFEPLETAYKVFKNLFSKFNNVKIFQCAVGDESKNKYINISKRNDSSSLLEISSLQVSNYPGTELKETRLITVKKLSDCIDTEDLLEPVLLKIDVQGYELNALKGCEDFFPYIDTIYCECSFVELYKNQALSGEVISYLDTNGFVLDGVYNIHQKSGKQIQGDFLFQKKIKIDF